MVVILSSGDVGDVVVVVIRRGGDEVLSIDHSISFDLLILLHKVQFPDL